MTASQSDEEIRQFYSEASLSSERMDLILESTRLAKSAKSWKRIAVSTSIGMVAVLLVATTLVIRLQMNEPAELTLADDELKSDPPSAATSDSDIVGSEIESSSSIDTTAYRLVAFRSHGNECPFCRATGIVYEELEAELNNQLVSFEQFDLSKVSQGEQIARDLSNQNLDSLIEGRIETAFLALVDQTGNPIKEFKPSETASNIAEEIRQLIEP